MDKEESTQDKTAASLDTVYASASTDQVAANYAAWAATYDAETASYGYLLPFLITAWAARYVPPGDGPLLDVGCGTGLSGPCLKALGYGNIAGLDISGEMLAIAKGRDAYRELKKAALGEALPWPDGHFRAFLSAGVFTMGHAPASSLHELARITRRGGHAIFTVRREVLEDGGFRRVFAELEQAGRWRPVEEGPFFRCYAVADPEAMVKPFVFEVL